MPRPIDEIILSARLALEHKTDGWTPMPDEELAALCDAAEEAAALRLKVLDYEAAYGGAAVSKHS